MRWAEVILFFELQPWNWTLRVDIWATEQRTSHVRKNTSWFAWSVSVSGSSWFNDNAVLLTADDRCQVMR